ncbi:MAG: ABC transporter permease [Bacteroidales bacterium]|nr:MAG: ABC transporter permease [Bacteroidales bacterium]
MIRIFFKTIWNQRSRNILIFIEMLLVFLVLSNLSVYYTNLVSILRIPNCYQHENVVLITINSQGEGPEEAYFGKHLNNLKFALQANEYVEAVSISHMATPFNYNLSSNSYKYGDESFGSAYRTVDLDYGEVMRINVLKGRWFNETDRGKKVRPVVLEKEIEDETFNGDALGKRFGEDNYEVVGITGAFKRSDSERPFVPTSFHLREIQDSNSYSWEDFLVRVREGHVNDFLNIVNREVFSVLNSRYWTISTLNTLENQQAWQNSESRFKRLISVIVALFVIINILLGIIGILWYNTNLRIHEIGIKRAMGNYGNRIIRQIIAENIILSLLSAIPVLIILAQAKGLRIAVIEGNLFLLSQALAIVILLVLVVVCSWLPAKIASSIHPANALKYE